jgi:hypothetical protein
MSGSRIDFFVSHADPDRAWAEWVANQLKDAGYSVELDVWNWSAGQYFITAISEALDRSDRVVALASVAYFNPSRYTTFEWVEAMRRVPGRDDCRLVLLRIEDVPVDDMPAVLRGLIRGDLFGRDEKDTRAALLEAVSGPRPRIVRRSFPAARRVRGFPAARVIQDGWPAGQESAMSRRAIRHSPAGLGCSRRCTSDCLSAAGRWCCMESAGLARLSWRSSTHIGSPPTMT